MQISMEKKYPMTSLVINLSLINLLLLKQKNLRNFKALRNLSCLEAVSVVAFHILLKTILLVKEKKKKIIQQIVLVVIIALLY